MIKKINKELLEHIINYWMDIDNDPKKINDEINDGLFNAGDALKYLSKFSNPEYPHPMSLYLQKIIDEYNDLCSSKENEIILRQCCDEMKLIIVKLYRFLAQGFPDKTQWWIHTKCLGCYGKGGNHISYTRFRMEEKGEKREMKDIISVWNFSKFYDKDS